MIDRNIKVGDYDSPVTDVISVTVYVSTVDVVHYGEKIIDAYLKTARTRLLEARHELLRAENVAT